MGPVPNLPAEPDDDLDSYVGLDAAAAEERARARGWSTVRTLPPGAIITMEYLRGRIDFEVDEGTVKRCWRG
ncbi:I78 family peptidase inhibitor [Streptomyces sp. DSM 41524]|uniref:I78 family peptidase inhibitor n=1 Tax=Streptomyces asiaticus subsp. ignotus TaxID=3098222 RepID=A0ABU7Q1L1_9ACTN|nr:MULTISPECIES: I78 family peptidase inhibitor [unclassified Streptomyces]MBA6438048.1 proteinase inhibitor I78 [Streptomyces sp. GMR22]MBI0381617.1 proteinase inhibitor I78 [Streptomyces albiflaviniger]MEE4594541.1 I78 family peptidase inhibitor [Streptomyces sp. DSM 41524]TMU97877.1 proteinase inhibitor I78 [Streptomyces sp. DASNCL29]